MYIDEDADYDADEVCDANVQVDKLGDGRFRTKLSVAR